MGVIVRQKTKGKGKPWWVFISHNGKRKSIRVGDKESAERVARAVRERLAKGNLNIGERKAPTFREWAEKWLELDVKPTCGPSTVESYTEKLRKHILPVLADMPMDRITRGTVKDFLVSKLATHSPSTVNVMRNVISGVFGYAVDAEIVTANPTAGLRKRLALRRVDADENGAVEPLTQDEADAFLEACRVHFPEYHPFFLVALRTGMRVGEILGLRWEDVDLVSKLITVRRAYRRGRFGLPKGNKGRKVDISDQLAETLKAHLTRERKRTLKDGSGELPELVFHRKGRAIEQAYIRKIFGRALAKAGLRRIRVHDLRHTFATLLLMKTGDVYYTARQLGHSKTDTTIEIYSHWLPQESKRSVNLLDAPTCSLSAPDSLERSGSH